MLSAMLINQERVLLALRISRDDDSSTSVEIQDTRGTGIAEARGQIIVGRAKDEDVSGGIPPAERPDLGKWMKTPHLFDAIWFDNVSRLMRDMEEAMLFFRWARENGITIYIRDPDVNTRTWTTEQKLLVIMMCYGAEKERTETIKRVNGQVPVDRKIGKYLGGKVPFWLCLVKHPSGKGKTYARRPEWTPLLDELIRRAFARQSVRSIAVDLNKRRVPTPEQLRVRKEDKEVLPTKGKWSGQVIKNILLDYRLIGWHLVTPQDKTLEPYIVRDDDGKPIPYMYEAPLTPDQFYALRAILLPKATEGTHKAKLDKNHTPMVKLLWCGLCAHAMAPKRNRFNTGYFRCRSTGEEIYDSCGSLGIREEIVYETLEQELGPGSWLSSHLLYDRKDPVRVRPEEIAHLEDEYEAVVNLYRVTKDPDKKARYLAEVQELERQLEVIRQLAAETVPVYVATGRSLGDVWSQSDWYGRGDLMRRLGIRVNIVGPNEGPGTHSIEIVYPEDIAQRIKDPDFVGEIAKGSGALGHAVMVTKDLRRVVEEE